MSSRKRLKVGTNYTTECVGDIIAELDLEIALRRRLAETAESRIAWARLLQESLRAGSSGASASFQDAAFQSLEMIEKPLDVLFKREVFPIRRPNHNQSTRVPRPLPNKQTAVRNSNASFLYIRSGYLQPPYDDNHVQTYLIRCPSCLRKKFTSLQGLLNHARLSHGMEWGTHEECVRACIVADPELDLEEGIEVGAGPNGLLPGLRSLFEMAVGVHQQPKEPAPDRDANQVARSPEQGPTVSHLVSALGLHQDTPALAPFLGKQAIRRNIEVWNSQDDNINIDGFEDTTSQDPQRRGSSRRIWKMHFPPRNDFQQEDVPAQVQELVPAADTEQPTDLPFVSSNGDPQVPVAEPSDLGMGSRFHFVARVIITDRSHWIPPEKRSEFPDKHTHKWMISVDAPSYSYHITTILKRLTVSSASTSKILPSTTSSPPFVVVGTTDEPFLAKVELQFSGTSIVDGDTSDQPVTLEHWVELDLLKSATAVIGDEQVVDIELDKATVLLPVQKGYTPIGAKVLWSQTSETRHSEDLPNAVGTLPVYSQILKNLVGKFPMTFKGSRHGRQFQPRVPYKLVSAVEFEGYVMGRKKAIEWSRASAIQAAYVREIGEPQHAAQNPSPLSVADVYRWLLEEGHFLRSSDPESTILQSEKISKHDQSELWCPVCGMSLQAHTAWSSMKTELVDASLTLTGTQADSKSQRGTAKALVAACSLAPNVHRLPMLNVRSQAWGASNDSSLASAQELSKFRETQWRSHRGAALISSVDPKLIMATYDIVRSLKLSSFQLHPLNDPTPYPLDQLGRNHTQVETRLAPFALLSISVKVLLRVLVEGGLQFAKAQKFSRGHPAAKKREQRVPNESVEPSVLTPAHILQSVIVRAQGPPSETRTRDVAIFELLADLGVPPTHKETSISQDDIQEAHKLTLSIKQEEHS